MMSTKPLENNLRCHPLKSLGVTLIVIYLNLCLLRNMTYCHCLKFPSSVITRLTLWRSDEWWPPRDEVECRMGCSPGGLMEVPGPPSNPSAPWRAPCCQGCQMAKFDPFLSLDCARVEGKGAIQGKEGIKFCSAA